MPRSIPFRSLCNICTVGLLSVVLAANGHAQQPPSPNFGQAKTESEGNWLTKRLPWNNAAKKPGSSQRRPIQHRKVSAQEKRIGQFSMARLAEKRGQTEAAMKMYEALAKQNPKDSAPYHRLGVILAKQGDNKSAAQWLMKARSLNPRDPEIYRDMGYLYYKNGRPNDAEKLYQQGLQLDAKNQGLVNNYAMILAEKEQYQQSLELFQSVNKPAEAHANMGFILAQMGHLDKAEAYFHQALTLDKDLKSAAHGLIQTAQLKAKVTALRKQADAVAAKETLNPVQASLSDEPAAASRIGTASSKHSQVKQVARIETKGSQVKQVARIETKDAPPAIQIDPIRSGAAQIMETAEPRQLIAPSTSTGSQGRRAVEAKPNAAGPARQRNTLRIGSSMTSKISSDHPRTDSADSGSDKGQAAPTAESIRPPSQFHWSTNRFPTSRPTWTPNPAKTEVPR